MVRVQGQTDCRACWLSHSWNACLQIMAWPQVIKLMTVWGYLAAPNIGEEIYFVLVSISETIKNSLGYSFSRCSSTQFLWLLYRGSLTVCGYCYSWKCSSEGAKDNCDAKLLTVQLKLNFFYFIRERNNCSSEFHICSTLSGNIALSFYVWI